MFAPESFRILLIGKGGREHALAWKLSSSNTVEHVYVYPGNGGTARGMHKVSNIPDPVANYDELVAASQSLRINLVIVGPDDDVVGGIEEFFRRAGIACFAPTREAAEIEGSKTFAKDFMKRHNIPTAAYENFNNIDLAKSYVDNMDRVVIKASGLAAGKGVVLPKNKEEAYAALEDIMVKGVFSTAGDSVVIEEYLEGDEISVLTFSDGRSILSMPPGQDHKRIYENNTGPNTGGMGVYAPVSFVTGHQMDEIEASIIRPTLAGLEAEGRIFRGMIFTGIMMTQDGPKVLEYNARFGDPETQSMMMLLSPETDLASILWSCTQGGLVDALMTIRPGFAVNVVVAAGGYPETYETGDDIELPEPPHGVQIFHAGTEVYERTLRTAGGRVLSVAAYGKTLKEATELAYDTIEGIKFRGMYFRKDIARRYVMS